MKARYRLFNHHGTYYFVDSETGRQQSLRTKQRREADTLVAAKNEAGRQPKLNFQLARVYLSAADEAYASRSWQTVLDTMVRMREGAALHRWKSVGKDKAYRPLWNRTLIETQAEHLLAVLEAGTVSTNIYLRRMHNFALDMNWLPLPLIPRKQWPQVRHGEKRAVTAEEHARIVARESNPERKAFYQMAWHLGASQTDLAHLQAEDIDWTDQVIAFHRRKTGSVAQISFGVEVAEILISRPRTGPLFPYLMTVREADRATEFRQRCQGLKIEGITLHSYRYAWAERAKSAGYPERFAQVALGHNSKAVHRAYSKKAVVKLPPLEDYERALLERKVIPLSPPSLSLPTMLAPTSGDKQRTGLTGQLQAMKV